MSESTEILGQQGARNRAGHVGGHRLAKSWRCAAVGLAFTAGCAGADPGAADDMRPLDEAQGASLEPDSETAEDATRAAVSPGDATSASQDVEVTPESSTSATEPTVDEASACQVPPGVDDSPEDIPELLTLLNSLPRPASIACFLESLARPLYAYPTKSVFSAQPAAGTTDPRVFLFLGDSLIVSVVSAGVGEDLLEYSYLTSAERSVKGEIPFPLIDEVTTQGIVAHIQYSEEVGSVCYLCHADERPAGEDFYEGALESEALRPLPAYDVSLDVLRVEAALCDAEATPKRCATLSGLFDHGDVLFQTFPEKMPTFY